MLNPARHMTGNRQTDWITMPSVVPIPSRSRPKLETVSARCAVDGRHVQEGDEDDHDVVDDRRPHVGAEPAAHVEDRAEQRVHPVEEDLRDEEVGEHHHDVVLAGVRDVAAVQVDDRPGEQRGHHGDDEQRDHAERVDPLRVPLAPVRVLLGRADQHRDHDRGEDAAEHQVVHGVRQRVGVVVGVGERAPGRGRSPARACAGTRSPGTRACRAPSPCSTGPGWARWSRRPAAARSAAPGRRPARGSWCGCPGRPAAAPRSAGHEPRRLAAASSG